MPCRFRLLLCFALLLSACCSPLSAAFTSAAAFIYRSDVLQVNDPTDGASATATGFGYDLAGRQVQQQNQWGGNRVFHDDNIGRLTSTVSPLGRRVSQTWNSRGPPGPGSGAVAAAGKIAVKAGAVIHTAETVAQVASSTAHATDALRVADTLAAFGCFPAGTPVLSGEGEKPIEALRVGNRVLTRNEPPAGQETLVDSATWQLATLHLKETGGSEMEVQALRPPEWMQKNGVVAGATVWLELAEMGLEGEARVEQVEPCPPIASGPGRVVLASFTRSHSAVLRLHFEGEPESLELTASHPLYSLSRQQWVPVGQLRQGELLQTRTASCKLATIEHLPGTRPVFNLEVEGEHEFYAGKARLLAHNSCGAVVSSAAKTGGDFTRVGRWMSQAEHDAMVAAGRVQESTSLRGVTSVTSPPNAATWARQTEGTIFTEFDVPTSALRGGGTKIYGPNSIFGPKLNITEMPPAFNIQQTASKWPQ